MTYTIGDRKITLRDNLSQADIHLLLAHSKLFKYCLNNATFKFLINLKKLVHLYADIITIYSTLLKKIPNYDDITLMAYKAKLNVLKLEGDYNELFGEDTSNNFNANPFKLASNWEEKNYENNIKKFTILMLDSTIETFDIMFKTLRCIDVFFCNFNNLKKLLIPYLLSQTTSISKSLQKAQYLYHLTTITDDMGTISEITAPILKQLRKIEKITSGIERESSILEYAFLTFNPSLEQYTSILLGKAILKREVPPNQCQLIKRRDVCLQAAEHVVSIPLTEDTTNNSTYEYLRKYLSYGVMLLVALIALFCYRLIHVIFGQ
ncbi:hypothetical protein DFJ63DRAFT_20486 [Scheffersomyces coipomensis]|uniref:uncharacterized protein n=1 Tax=Scheffersomyces coipomensis TaxID=1788519 RepID=UPI00315D1754